MLCFAIEFAPYLESHEESKVRFVLNVARPSFLLRIYAEP